MNVNVEVSTRDCVIATWDRVLLALWRGRTTVAAVRRGGELICQQAAEHGPLLMITVIEEGAPLPALEARMELVTVLKRANGMIDRSALVFEGEGFRAATVRAIVAGVSLFSRPDYPHRVFASVGAAARFLAHGKPGELPPHRVIRMVAEARRAPGTQTFLPWLHNPAGAMDSLRTR
jgi:hypothetical protein